MKNGNTYYYPRITYYLYIILLVYALVSFISLRGLWYKLLALLLIALCWIIGIYLKSIYVKADIYYKGKIKLTHEGEEDFIPPFIAVTLSAFLARNVFNLTYHSKMILYSLVTWLGSLSLIFIGGTVVFYLLKWKSDKKWVNIQHDHQIKEYEMEREGYIRSIIDNIKTYLISATTTLKKNYLSSYNDQSELRKDVGNDRYNIADLVCQEMKTLLSENDIAKLPEQIAEKKWMTNSEYYEMASTLFSRTTKQSKFISEMPDFLCYKHGEVTLSSDTFAFTKAKLEVLKRYFDDIKCGIDYQKNNNIANFDNLAELLKNDAESRWDPDKINSLISAAHYMSAPFDIDKASAWISEALRKYNNYEENFKESLSEYLRLETGEKGEKSVLKYLKGFDYRYLFNANIKDGNQSTECDAIWFRPEGIYVAEIKNYSGATVSVDKNKKVSVTSKEGDAGDPIAQNEKHVNALKAIFVKEGMLDVADKIKGIIVIPNAKMTIINESDYPIVTLPYFDATVSKEDKVFTNDNLEKILSITEKYLAEDKKFPFVIPTISEYPFDNIEKGIDKVLAKLSLQRYPFPFYVMKDENNTRYEESAFLPTRKRYLYDDSFGFRMNVSEEAKSEKIMIKKTSESGESETETDYRKFYMHWYEDWYDLRLQGSVHANIGFAVTHK